MTRPDSPFPEFEFQPSAELDIFNGAVSSLQGRPFNGADFNASMFEVTVNYVPHLVEEVPVLPENRDACQESVLLLARYTHHRVASGLARVNDYMPDPSEEEIKSRRKIEFQQAYGLAPSSPATFVDMTLRSIVAYEGKLTNMMTQRNLVAWRFATKEALKSMDNEILASLEFTDEN